MLPAFDNIVRINDHAEATYIGADQFEVVTTELTAYGDLKLKPLNGYGYREFVYASPRVIEWGILTLFAK